MKFSIFATLPLLAFATAMPAVEAAAAAPNNTPKIVAGLTTLGNDITKLDNLVLASSVNVIAVQNAEQVVEKDITAIVNNAKASSVVTAAQSTQILNQIRNTIVPKITKVLNDLVAKKASFAAVKGIVKSDLQKLNTQTGNLGAALIAKATGPAKTNAPAVVKSIQDKFAVAIKAFS